MTNLTYKQAYALCNADGMPIEVVRPEYDGGLDTYRLTPSAPLTPDQAGMCLARGVTIQAQSNNDEHGEVWIALTSLDDFTENYERLIDKYRVPPTTTESQRS